MTQYSQDLGDSMKNNLHVKERKKPRHIIIQLLFYFLMIISYVMAWPLFFSVIFLPRCWGFFIFRYLSRYFLFMARLFLGIKWVCRGEFPKDKPFIVASKHQSLWETIWFLAYGPNTIFIFKKSLVFIPFIGWALWALGMIPVDRKKTNKGLYDKALKNIPKNGCLVIFPEGTRYAPGHHGHYRNGIYKLFQTLELPIVPVALNTGLFWPKDNLTSPGTIVVEILPTLEVSYLKTLNRQEFLQILGEKIDKASDDLL